MKHTIQAHSPLGADVLRFRSMQGTESLSTPFEFDVDLVADDASLALKPLLGQSLTLQIETQDGGARYLDGIVVRAMLVGREGGIGQGAAREYRYRAVLRPWLWLLTQTRDCKIFQNRTVPQILQEVLGEYGYPVENRLTASYRNWGYCVQYQESDFDFVSRLMEHEGIYYYFEHALGSHTLVLADDMSAHTTLPGYASIPFFQSERVASSEHEVIDVFQVAEGIAPGAYVTDDYNFTKPGAKLGNQRANPASHAHGDLEVYDWMGGYGEADESDHISRIRLEELQSERERDEGHAYTRGLAPGYRFNLTGSPVASADREYLVVSVSYRLHDASYASVAGTAPEALYECEFETQPTSLPFRPRRVTPRPHTHGPQTAVVVGPPGETIYTDEYGRVKVQFRWDRIGTNDENSSCWLRVASSAAGSGMGQVNIPRIGQEVVVDFIGGLPDRPIVMGCTYNADMMTAFGLPDNASRSGFVSRTLKGGPDQANHMFFEDKLGAEELSLHAEKDYKLSVENDKSNMVGNDQNETIGAHSTHKVGGNKNTRIGQDYDHDVGGTSTRRVDGSSTEIHHSDYSHTTVGPSTILRQAPHEQRYEGTYDHHVTGPADSTYQLPHVHTHGASFDHDVAADHNHRVGGQYRHEVGGHHTQAITADHNHGVDGNHTTTITGNHVHTVGGTHTLTAMGDSHHAATGTHTLVAKEIKIGSFGGGGGDGLDDFTYTFDSPTAGPVTNKISLKAARANITYAAAYDISSAKLAVTPFNFSLDLVKVNAPLWNNTVLSVDAKLTGAKFERFAGAWKKETIAAFEDCHSLHAHADFIGGIDGVVVWK